MHIIVLHQGQECHSQLASIVFAVVAGRKRGEARPQAGAETVERGRRVTKIQSAGEWHRRGIAEALFWLSVWKLNTFPAFCGVTGLPGRLGTVYIWIR
jgi:hypothetical protein